MKRRHGLSGNGHDSDQQTISREAQQIREEESWRPGRRRFRPGQVTDFVVGHPITSVLTGLGVGWLVLRRRSQGIHRRELAGAIRPEFSRTGESMSMRQGQTETAGRTMWTSGPVIGPPGTLPESERGMGGLHRMDRESEGTPKPLLIGAFLFGLGLAVGMLLRPQGGREPV